MEVHHHSHTARKKWSHYFWEFLMLFLAVFCGFLAEYQLEHTIEHQREKQYLKSLIADLKTDQQILDRHIAHLERGISMMDTMIGILSEPGKASENAGQLYYFARLAPRLTPLSTNNRTFEQLKNSGNFRLIRNITTSNRIMNYYEKFPTIRLLEAANESEFNEYKKIASKIFKGVEFLKMEGEAGEIKRATENPALQIQDNKLFQELTVFSVYLRGTKKGILSVDKDLKSSGLELIDFLQQEYHLE